MPEILLDQAQPEKETGTPGVKREAVGQSL